MELKNFKCPNCGASVSANPNLDTAMCNMCGTVFALTEEDTVKHAINKVTGIANKWMDNKKEKEIREAEERKENSKDVTKMIILFSLLFCVIIPLALLLLGWLMKTMGLM